MRRLIIPLVLVLVAAGAYAAGKFAGGWPLGGKAQSTLAAVKDQVQLGDARLVSGGPTEGESPNSVSERQRGALGAPPVSKAEAEAAARRLNHAVLPCGDVWTGSNLFGPQRQPADRIEYYCSKGHAYYEGAGRFVAFR